MAADCTMRALTIHQPWAELVARGEKRVENRRWRTHYRGRLAIHVSRWRPSEAELEPWGLVGAELTLGAIVAVAELVDCLEFVELRTLEPDLAASPHALGPWCWVLADVRRLRQPIECPGRQRLWTAPSDVVRAIARLAR